MKNVLGKIWNGWKRFGRALGRVNTVILLTIIYFLILSPFGLVMRLCTWNPLRGAKDKNTNFVRIKDSRPDYDSLKRQS